MAIGGVLFIALVVFLIYTAIDNSTKISYTILTSPINTQVTIDGRVHKNKDSGSTFALHEGEYEVVISRDGFSSYSTNIKVENGGDNELKVILEAQSNEARSLLLKTDEDANLQLLVMGSYSNIVESIQESNPILTKLPFYGTYFTISQGVSVKENKNPGSFALYIEVYDKFEKRGKEDAMKWFSKNNFNPDDFEIIYKTTKYTTRDEEKSVDEQRVPGD